MKLTRRQFQQLILSSAGTQLIAGCRQSAQGQNQECLYTTEGQKGALTPGDLSRPRLNPLRLLPVDLRTHIRLGVQHIYQSAVDRKQGCRPFGTVGVQGGKHYYWDTPHMVGRFLDALAVSAEVIDFPPDDEADHGLRKLLHESLDNPAGLAYDIEPGEDGQRGAWMHNCREVLLGLLALMKWKKCERSEDLARKFVRTLEKVTRETGTFPAMYFNQQGWGKPEKAMYNNTSGRLVGALVKFYRLTRDDLALTLAKRFADVNIEKAFTPEGELREEAGTHLHSTEGTMTSIIDLGVITGEKRYAELGRQLYDVGLSRQRTTYGWAREDLKSISGRGEANNIGDFIETGLILALNGQPRYFREAECMIRNHLLASQVVNTDGFAEPARNKGLNTHEINHRLKGLFGFTEPNRFLGYNTDLMGGALQSLAEAYHAIVSRDHQGQHVNMLFPVDLPEFSLRSCLPQVGRLVIKIRRPSAISIRIPNWVGRKTVRVWVQRRLKTPVWMLEELALGTLAPNTKVEISFDQPRRHTQEGAPGYKTIYEIDWLGDTIVAMKPVPESNWPLY